jgi:hypothetical protein
LSRLVLIRGLLKLTFEKDLTCFPYWHSKMIGASILPINLVMTKQPRELLHLGTIGPSRVWSVGGKWFVLCTCLEICLSSIDKTLCSLLHEELASLFEFSACLYLPWFQGEYGFCYCKSLYFSCYPLEFGNWYLPSLWLGLRGSLCFTLYILYPFYRIAFHHIHIS